ncbi:MAG TPA: WYL domain-containing protein [Edaphobacter sp.]
MRSDRLLSALLLLQAHGRLTGRELAERLEVSARTVHRDMESLSASGVPVYALRGAQGGWQLDETWRTQVPSLSEPELRALLMAQPRVIGNTHLEAAAERALEKLMAALPTSLRTSAASIRQRLYVDPTGWRGPTEDLSALPIVQDALSLDRKLAFHYNQPGRQQIERTVDPLGLIAKGNNWYLFADTPQGFRTYTVARIEKPRLLDQPSHRPAHFDLPTAWKASTERYQTERPAYYATLSIEPRTAEWISIWRTTTPAPHPQTALPKDWKTLRIEFDHEGEAAFFALGLGIRAIVVEPEALRTHIAADIAALIRRSQTSSV